MLKTTDGAKDAAHPFGDILEGVRAVAVKTAARRDEIEKARKFPADLYDELEATGAFRLCAPKEYGGLELTLGETNELVFEGARGMGSLGWLMMIGIAQSFGTGLYPEETVRRIFGEKQDLRTRGVIAPRGMAVPVEGGYFVSGQWPFASGGPGTDYVSGNCIVMEGGQPKIGPSGTPEAILAMMPASEVEFLDTWHVIGMRGTDSCDVRVKDVFVPSEMTFDLHHAVTCFDTPASRMPLRVALSFSHCALALGIAQGAIDDVLALARTKSASMNPAAKLRDDLLFRDGLGRQHVRLSGLRAMLDRITEQCWTTAGERREFPPDLILTARLMAHHITTDCLAIVTWAYTAGGSSSVYDGSSLQVRMRDMHVATQHASCHPDPYRLLGAALLGEELTPAELF